MHRVWAFGKRPHSLAAAEVKKHFAAPSKNKLYYHQERQMNKINSFGKKFCTTGLEVRAHRNAIRDLLTEDRNAGANAMVENRTNRY